MKLARKISLALGLCALAALGSYALISLRREVAHYEADMKRDHRLLGDVLALAISKTWREAGEKGALALLDEAARTDAPVKLRWVWLDSADANFRPQVDPRELEPLPRTHQLSVVENRAVGKGRIFTYVSVPLGTPRHGAIELSESLDEERLYVAAAIEHALLTILGVGAVAGALAAALGLIIVGRPMQALADKARRVGTGDLSGPLNIVQQDEIGALAAEMNRMCDQLSSVRDQLRHADRLSTVGHLASGIAHEMGTPLNVISLRAKMIAVGESTPAEVPESARIIVAQADGIARIIRQLLDFARRRERQTSSHDVVALTASTLEILRPLAEKQRVELVLKGTPGSLFCPVDHGHLQQALTNLVINGLQAMAVRGARLTVGVTTSRVQPPADHGGPEGDYVQISVEDEGEGIPEEVQGHVFEPFYTTKAVGEGTGLGLSVSYGLVREQGGWISLSSERGKGSCFSIHLPLGEADARPHPDSR